LRTCAKSLKESTRCLAAARKETVQLRDGGGVDPRLVAKDEPYALDPELAEDFTGEEWAALRFSSGCQRTHTSSPPGATSWTSA